MTHEFIVILFKDYSAYFMSLTEVKAFNMKLKIKMIKFFEKILSKADILVENFKPGTLEKWGLWLGRSKKNILN